jgi:FkbM family methyltransferase
MKIYSQHYQDFFIDFFFKKKRSGIFLDIGANDGISFSNTYHFEKFRNWTGVCIEPHPEIFEKLQSIRSCHVENCCISDYEKMVTFRKVTGTDPLFGLDMLSGIVEFMSEYNKERIDKVIKINGGGFVDIEVQSYNINTILQKYNMFMIDYCSIDTEGAEYEIVTSIDFEKYRITSFSIEGDDENISQYLDKQGYVCVKSELDNFYVKRGTKRLFLFVTAVKMYKLYWKIWRRLPKFLQKMLKIK